MSKKIKIGIIGAGRMAGWFSEGLTVVEDAVRYAVGSRTLEKAQTFADKYGFQKAYGSYEEILNDPEVDLVYIATPIRGHYANIKAALEAGKPVLCEKSLTVNAAQAEEDEADDDFRIVRMKHFAIKPMSAEEAILQMNLLGHEFFVFRNMDEEEAISVVYKRKKGGYGLIVDEKE